MTTRVHSKATKQHDQQRLILRDKPREVASMEGWRIEVREELDNYCDGDSYRPIRANGDMVRLSVMEFVLAPQRLTDDADWLDKACADPLFETIYVSRELDAAEADTLRRLMAVECARERERHPLLMVGSETRGVFDRVHMGTIPGHPGGVGLIKTLDGPRVPVGVCIGADPGHGHDETVYTVRYGAVTMVVDGAESKATRTNWRDVAPVDPKPAAPRVPQVGDEVEVRGQFGLTEWTRATVTNLSSVLPRIGKFAALLPDGQVGCASVVDEGKHWRWPEAKREETRAQPMGGVSRGCLTFDALIGISGAWRRGPGSLGLVHSIARVMEDFDRCTLAFQCADDERIITKTIEGNDLEADTAKQLASLFDSGMRLATA